MKAKELIELGFTREYVPAEENGSEYGYEYYVYCINGSSLLITNECDDYNNLDDFDFKAELFYYSEFGFCDDYQTIKEFINSLNKFKKE